MMIGDKILNSPFLKTVDSILHRVFIEDNPKKSILDGVITSFDKPSEYLKFLSKKDPFTDILYPSYGERSIFPKKRWYQINPSAHVGFIGDQISQSHKESLSQLASLSVFRMSKLVQDKKDRELFLLAALYHHSGKKYSAKTSHIPKNQLDDAYLVDGNITGELIFTGYEKLSAYFLAKKLKDIQLSLEEAKKYVAAVYYQNVDLLDNLKKPLSKRTFLKPQQEALSKESYIKLYTDDSYELLLKIKECSSGLSSYNDLYKSQDSISKGTQLILKELDPFVVNLSSRVAKTKEEISKKFYLDSQADEFEQHHQDFKEQEKRKKEIEEVREKHKKEYEKIIKEEAQIVEKQREMEYNVVSQKMNLDIVLAIANAKARERKKQQMVSNKLPMIDIDGDGIDDREDFSIDL